MPVWQWSFLGNPLRAWGAALLITLPVLAGLWVAQRVLLRHFRTLAQRTKTGIDDLIVGLLARTRLSLLTALALYAGSLALTFPAQVTRWIGAIAFAVLLLQVAIWGDALISLWLARRHDLPQAKDAARATTARTVGVVARIVLFVVLGLLALDNLPGIEVTSLVASLGIGGIAIALAVQSILGDIFASLSIALDRPFVIGDSIVVDDYSGTVEHIGLKTTRLRSLSGEQLIFSNADLLKSRIRNYKRMRERRVVFAVGVTYETPREKVAAIPALLQEIVESQPSARFDRAHLKALADSSLSFEVVYHMLEPDYRLYMDTQQAVNLAILERFAAEGIQLAYPTHRVFVSRAEVGQGFPPAGPA